MDEGYRYMDIKQNLNLSSGALTYHLDVLEREKLVQSQNRGSKKLHFPAGVPMPEDGGGLHELQLRMLRVVDERPGIPLRDLAGGSSPAGAWPGGTSPGRVLPEGGPLRPPPGGPWRERPGSRPAFGALLGGTGSPPSPA